MAEFYVRFWKLLTDKLPEAFADGFVQGIQDYQLAIQSWDKLFNGCG